jgi:GntR family transcriptional regulator, vanillate catabolism transcriptional regulator
MGEADRMSLVDKAIIALRSLIMSGELAPAARVAEVALSERLGISRTPIRQAMDRLTSEGLLERIETGGCRVASFSITDIMDAIEIRGVIEGTAARMAAERGADEADLRACDELLARIDTALARPEGIDFDAYVALNAQFHHQLSTLAQSPVILREVERVMRLPLASPSAFLQEQALIRDFQTSLVRAQTQHKAMVAAIRNREGARAEALGREHARLARENLEYVMNADRQLAARLPGLSLVASR